MKAGLSIIAFLSVAMRLLSPVSAIDAIPCTFCTRGEITLHDKPISIPGYEFIETCGQVETLLPAFFDEDADECSLMQSLSTFCGCPPPEDSCSLCPDGSAVVDTDKEVPWLAPAFQGIVPSCGLVEAYVASLESTDGTCSTLQSTSSYCGCPARQDHCVFCPGETLQDEYKDAVLPFLSNEDMGITGTCEMFFLIQDQLPPDHEICALSQHITWHCGCNNNVLGYYGTSSTTEQAVLAWLPRASAILSLIGSFLIFWDILRDKSKRVSVYHQIIFLAACFDTVTSSVWMVGTKAVEKMNERVGLPWGVYGAEGNVSTCTAQGFFFQLGFTSLFLNVALTIYYLLVIVYGYRETKLKRMRWYFLAPPLVIGLSLSFAVIPFVDIAWSACQFDVYPQDEYLWSLLLFGLVPILGSLVVILVVLVVIYCKVNLQLSRGAKFSMSGVSGRILSSEERRRSRQQRPTRISAQQRLERDVFWQCVSYAAAFCITWPILAVAEIEGNNFDFPTGFWYVVAIVAPMQGFNNALCYFRPCRRKRRYNAVNPSQCLSSSAQMQLQRATRFLRSNFFRSSIGDSSRRSGSGSDEFVEVGDPTVCLANFEPNAVTLQGTASCGVAELATGSKIGIDQETCDNDAGMEASMRSMKVSPSHGMESAAVGDFLDDVVQNACEASLDQETSSNCCLEASIVNVKTNTPNTN